MGYRSDPSNVDLLGDLDRIIDLDAEVANGARSWNVELAAFSFATCHSGARSLHDEERCKSAPTHRDLDPQPCRNPYRRVVTLSGPARYRIVAKIGVNSLARSDARRRRWQAPWPRMWHTSETLVIGIKSGIGCRAQSKPADKLQSNLRRMALPGLPAGRDYGSYNHS